MREITDITLFVRTSGEEIVQWNRQRIIDALIREAAIPLETAEEISREVERQIFSSGIATLTASLVRELVNARLVERGLEKARRMHARLGFPLYDVQDLIIHRNKENANVPHWPEGTNLALAEGIKREYALTNVFSPEVAEAHISGDIHIHDLGYIDRPRSVFQSLEYVKKFGLDLPDWFSVADPAKHAEVLLAHMVRFSAALQGNFSSWVRWDAVNILFAPYLAGMSDNSIKQLAQMLVFEFSQLATARGGQLMMSSMDIYWDLPVHLRDCRAIGPGGVETGRKYSHYLPDARRFACAVLEVFKEGDARGRPFFFPIPLIHLTKQAFLPENRGFLLQGCEAAAKTGNPHFIFDREKHSTLPGGKAASGAEPWKMRLALIQNVTINLARAGFLAAKSDAKLFAALENMLEIAARAQAEKAEFMNKLLGEEQGPLSFLTINRDGEPYLKMKDAGYYIGTIGLAELCHIHTGLMLEKDAGAVEFCSRVLKFIRKKTDVLSKKHGLRILPGHTPAESAAYKFARLDLKKFAPESARFIRGNLARGGVYYSGSACLPSAHGLDPGEQARIEGIFHKLVSGVYSRIRLNGESPGEIADILTRAFLDTGNLQMTFAPVFTSCLTCRMTFTGHFTECPRCSAGEIEIISKITGYFARSSSLNQGKLAELEDLRKKLP